MSKPYLHPKTDRALAAELVKMRQLVIKRLRAHGAYLFHMAATASQYIKFKDPRIGSLRIADHAGIDKYRYRWNLMYGGARDSTLDGKVRREFYGFGDLEQLLHDFELAAAQLEENFGIYNPAKDRFKDARVRTRDQVIHK